MQAALKLKHVDGVGFVVPVKSPSRKDMLVGFKENPKPFPCGGHGLWLFLVQLQPLTVFPSQLQVHMVLQLYPILRDHRYSARVGTVLDQHFLLPTESTKPQRPPQTLPPNTFPDCPDPLYLHLHYLHLPGTRPKDAPIEFLAPFLSYFSKTLLPGALPTIVLLLFLLFLLESGGCGETDCRLEKNEFSGQHMVRSWFKTLDSGWTNLRSYPG